jgi:hypothetical protein
MTNGIDRAVSDNFNGTIPGDGGLVYISEGMTGTQTFAEGTVTCDIRLEGGS